MTTRTLAVSLLVAVTFGLTAPAHAQHPDLSGTWALRVDSTAVRTVATSGNAPFVTGDMGIGWGAPLSIVQTPERLTVLYDAFTAYDLQPKVRLIYALDGSESRNAVVMGSGPPSRSTAAWQDSALIITTTFAAPADVHVAPAALVVTQTLTVGASGRLTIQASRLDANNTTNTVVATYTRR